MAERSTLRHRSTDGSACTRAMSFNPHQREILMSEKSSYSSSSYRRAESKATVPLKERERHQSRSHERAREHCLSLSCHYTAGLHYGATAENRVLLPLTWLTVLHTHTHERRSHLLPCEALDDLSVYVGARLIIHPSPLTYPHPPQIKQISKDLPASLSQSPPSSLVLSNTHTEADCVSRVGTSRADFRSSPPRCIRLTRLNSAISSLC